MKDVVSIDISIIKITIGLGYFLTILEYGLLLIKVFDHELRREVLKVTLLLRGFSDIYLFFA